MAIAATLDTDNEQLGQHGRRSGQAIDIVKVVGSTGAAGDTASVKLKNGSRNARVLGGSFAISSQTVTAVAVTITLKALVALGNDTVYLEIVSD